MKTSRKFPAIIVNQPLGTFYLTAIPASLLLRVCHSLPHIRRSGDERGNVEDEGNQRRLDPVRLRAISRYLDTQDATIPGTIILAANCGRNGLSLDNEEHAEIRWRIVPASKGAGVSNELGSVVVLEIPDDEAVVAAIVDGQHRLRGFEGVATSTKDMYLPCAVFLDLPTAQQASIFATINFNQKPVSKSQTYELFGYDLDEEEESSWSPDKLAVFFTRRLNADPESPFRGHIKVAAIDDRVLDAVSKNAQAEWMVSTATVVEGVFSLFTSDAKRDRDVLHKYPIWRRKRSLLKQQLERVGRSRVPPFRDLYLSADHDIVIYAVVVNFFKAVQSLLWGNAKNVVLRKTAGIQALFRVLKELSYEMLGGTDLKVSAWESRLQKCTAINFSDAHFVDASGKGRSRIQDAFLVSLNLKNIDDIRDAEFKEFLGNMLKDVKNA